MNMNIVIPQVSYELLTLNKSKFINTIKHAHTSSVHRKATNLSIGLFSESVNSYHLSCLIKLGVTIKSFFSEVILIWVFKIVFQMELIWLLLSQGVIQGTGLYTSHEIFISRFELLVLEPIPAIKSHTKT